ncbi:MAG: hypothetical protein WDO71_01325 [Bacteroidota bacterium]
MAAVKRAQNDFSGITEAIRYDGRGLNIKYDKNEPFAEQAFFTDPSFFDVFNFPLVAGNNNINDKMLLSLLKEQPKSILVTWIH